MIGCLKQVLGSLLQMGWRLRLWIALLPLALLFTQCQVETVTQGSVSDEIYIRQKNQSLYLNVSGYVGSRKLLLIVHGGPGGNSLDYRDSYVRDIVESQFAVAYWDQRFGGKSQGNGGDVSLEAYRDDLHTVIEYLKVKYGADLQIYVLGHSWGGFLTPYFLGHEQNQSLVSGWIQVDGAHNYPMNDSLTEVMLAERAAVEINNQRNAEHWQAVLDYCNSHNASDGYEVSVQLNQYAHEGETLMDSVIQPDGFGVGDPLGSYKHGNFNLRVSGILGIDGPTYNMNPDAYLSNIQIPALLLWGKYDFVCPPSLATDLLSKIGSTDKTLYLFEHSGHSPMVNEGLVFWTSVVDWIKTH
jgi:pimeloyl-ACP methyl ester carboxylesterase